MSSKLPTAPLAGVILAAGSSRRMGQPKALLSFGGVTFLETLLEKLLATDCAPILVVVGEHADQIAPLLSAEKALILRNYHPERGPFSSLQITAAALPPECAGAFICPVDHPAVRLETLKILQTAWAENPSQVVKPRYHSQGGHPVILGRDWIAKLGGLPPTANLRELLQLHPENVIAVEVADLGVLLNVDTPEDYQRLLNAL